MDKSCSWKPVCAHQISLKGSLDPTCKYTFGPFIHSSHEGGDWSLVIHVAR